MGATNQRLAACGVCHELAGELCRLSLDSGYEWNWGHLTLAELISRGRFSAVVDQESEPSNRTAEYGVLDTFSF